DQAVWMVEGLGPADALLAALHALVERAPLAERPCQPPASRGSWKPRKPATLAGERPVQEPDHGPERLLGLAIIVPPTKRWRASRGGVPSTPSAIAQVRCATARASPDSPVLQR